MKLESAYSAERCRAALDEAVGRSFAARGRRLGNWFRLRLREEWSFWNGKNRVGYVIYGRVREGLNGRAEIVYHIFTEPTDPLTTFFVFLAVLCLYAVDGDWRTMGLPWLLGLTAAVWAVLQVVSVLQYNVFRWEKSGEIREELENLLREAVCPQDGERS